MPPPDIRPLTATPETLAALSDLLIETVASGGSVSFMHPLPRDAATAFWTGWLASAARGERVALGALVGEELAGTVTLVLDCPPNQPHRAEIAKMMTRVGRRGSGIGSALLTRAEEMAIAAGRTLLNLDTASEDGASGFYERNGFTFAGEIPDYALRPHGGLTGTRLYWKRIG
jgi:ribosomal protein S18 acetylase RimI-like enzyme